MRKKTAVASILFLTLINMTALATLAYNRWIREPLPAQEIEERSWNSFQKEMELSPSQLNDMQVRRDRFRRSIDDLQNEMAERRIALLEEIRKGRPDMQKIDGAIDAISRYQAEIQKSTVRNLLKDTAILSREQTDRYLSIFLEQTKAYGMRRGRRFHGGRGHGRQGLTGRGKNRDIGP